MQYQYVHSLHSTLYMQSMHTVVPWPGKQAYAMEKATHLSCNLPHKGDARLKCGKHNRAILPDLRHGPDSNCDLCNDSKHTCFKG